jgi:hypothetical protein
LATTCLERDFSTSIKEVLMTGLSRVGVAVIAAGLVFTAQAGAAPPGEVVIERTTLHKEPFTVEELFPCLGEPGMQDDLAVISGFQTSQFTLTAAGVDETGEPIAPFRLRGNVHWKVSVDPVAEGLPNYTGSATTVFHQTVNRLGDHFIAHALFKATAEDGSDKFTFHFGIHVFVDPDGELRFEHVMDKFCSNE